MSVQIALLAATTAMAAYSAAKQGEANANALSGQAGGQRVQAGQYEVSEAQTKLQSANEELQRRRGLGQLLSANRADIATKGVSGEQGTSFDVIQDYNKRSAEEDIHNIRFMGESKAKQLSFAAQSSWRNAGLLEGMSGEARTQGYINAASKIGMAALSYFGMPGMGGGTTTPSPSSTSPTGGFSTGGVPMYRG